MPSIIKPAEHFDTVATTDHSETTRSVIGCLQAALGHKILALVCNAATTTEQPKRMLVE
jgi:hypothetical protein